MTPAKLDIAFLQASSILSTATGFISAFDFTLNPYSGCAFGCDYCYAKLFARSLRLKETWGQWVKIKENAVDLLRRRGERIAGKRIYMSSVTDPYQPIEWHLRLTRSLLEVMLPHQPRLVIQTRSPYVTRDLDLLRQFRTLRVNMSITTDDDVVRRVFERFCASIPRRLEVIEAVKSAGIKTGICLTPLLPVRDAHAFGERLRAANADVYVVQPFARGASRFAAGTSAGALALAAQYGWDSGAYERAKAILEQHLPGLYEERDGFMPE